MSSAKRLKTLKYIHMRVYPISADCVVGQAMHKLQFIIKPSLVIGFLGAAVVLMWGATAWLRLLAVSVPPLELTGIALLAAADNMRDHAVTQLDDPDAETHYDL